VYQVLQLAALVDGLTGTADAPPAHREGALLREMLAAFREGSGPESPPVRGLDRALDDMLVRVLERLSALSEELERAYFRRGAAAQQLVRVR